MNGKFRWRWRILSLLAAVLVGVGMLSVSARAEGEETGSGTESGEESSLSYLALGDSITDGYGLADTEESFVTLFAEAIGATEVNQISSSDGLTASQLLEDLNDSNIYAETYQEAVESADVITITIGGNDLMEGFYEVVAELYSASAGITIDADQVKTALKDPDANSEMVNALLTYINSLEDNVLGDISGQFATYISNCISDINQITGFIQEKNPDAVILVANQYNPYQWFGNEKVSNLFADVTEAYNSNLAYLSAYYGRFTVVDISSAFAESEDSLTNASASLSIDYSTGTYSISYDFDFHPNAAGHEVIAAAMAEAYETAVSESEEPGSGTESGGESGDESGLSYLALGDSITDGYGLADTEESFVTLFAEAIGATEVNQISSSDGLTASQLLTELSDATTYVTKYQEAIESADVITITIGGNDLMETFYEAVATLYNQTYASYGITVSAENVKTALKDPDTYSDMVDQLVALFSNADDATVASFSALFTDTITECVSDICYITAAIKTVNPDAVILVANQYNPYQWLGNETISNLFATVTDAYNEYLATAAAYYGTFTAVDISSAFAESTSSLTNASATITSFDFSTGTYTISYDFDFHPNATGHQVIAAAMLSAYSGSQGKEDTVVYTVAIPIELNVAAAGSAAAPEESFTIKAFAYYYDAASGYSGLIDVSYAGATYSGNEVSTNGQGTYSGTLTFTCGEDLASLLLTNGFYVSLVPGNSAGWDYDSKEYTVYVSYSNETGEAGYSIAYGEDTSLTAVSFTCTYTGWYLNFEVNGGSSVDSVAAVGGETISLSGYTTSRSGYDFSGWYLDSALSNQVTEVTMTGDVTVYARWTEVSQVSDDTSDDDNDDSTVDIFWSDVIQEAQTVQSGGGGTVTVDGGSELNALPNYVMKQLLENPDVTLVFEYEYNGAAYTIVIPAGTAVDDDTEWYGPLWLYEHYGSYTLDDLSGINPDTTDAVATDAVATDSAATGDSEMLVFWLAILAAAVCAVVLAGKSREYER